MQEIIQQIISYLRGMWRYRWYAMVVGWIIVLAGWMFVARMPDQYEASARVYADTDTMLRPLLRGLAIQTNVGERLRLMTRTILSRPNLEKVARMTDLDIQAKTPEQMEGLLNTLGNKIRLNSSRNQANLYTISYEDDDPQTAKKIVQALLTIFVESTLGESREDTDSAQKFLDQQIAEYEKKLTDAENQLTDFRRKYVGTLEGGSFYDKLVATQNELKNIRLAVREQEYRRNELQRQLEDFEDSEEDNPLFSAPKTPLISSVDGRIQAMQAKLDEMLLRYTEEHPDVKELKRTIAALEKQKQEELDAMVKETPATTGQPENPMYQQLKFTLAEAQASLAAIKAREDEYEQRVAKLRKLVDTQPQVETELKRLNRDYDVNKRKYHELVERRESAKMSEQANQTGDNLRFRVVDPPRVPLTPSGPNRPLLSGLVLLFALGGGLGLAFLLSQIRPMIYDRRTLRQLTGLPVFGTVTRVWTEQLRRKMRLETIAFASVGAMLVVAYGGVVFLHLHDGMGGLFSVVTRWL